jgi:hypothetical protein
MLLFETVFNRITLVMAGKQRPSSPKQVTTPPPYHLSLISIPVGSIAGTMSISQASSVLENWIIPLDLVSLQQGVPLTSLKKVIQKGLEKLRFQKKVELNCEEFILLCQFILDSCGDGGSESVGKDDQSSSGRRER